MSLVPDCHNVKHFFALLIQKVVENSVQVGRLKYKPSS